jgi:hypothetical protein
MKEIVKGNVVFKKGLSREYKDLVNLILVQDPNGRLPLVKVFTHPWVLHFQYKYKIERAASPIESSTSEESEASDSAEEAILKNSPVQMKSRPKAMKLSPKR